MTMKKIISDMDRTKVEKIRSYYTGVGSTKMTQLKQLNAMVKIPVLFTGIAMSVVGIIVLGLGLHTSIASDNIGGGITACVVGVGTFTMAIPVAKIIMRVLKAKYSSQILQLCDEIEKERLHE